MEIIAPWVIAALVAAGSFAFFVRIMDEQKRELRAEIAVLKAEIAKKDEYIEILQGERADLTGELRMAQGTLTADIAKAKLKRDLEQIRHPDDTHDDGRIEPPRAEWATDD